MGMIQDFNYIKQISVYPCSLPNPIVLVETAIEAGIPTLVELNQFSCIDIIKSRAGISWKCGRALKAVITAAHGAQVVDKTHFLYSLGAAQVERGLWWFFLAQLSTNFLARWTSLVYQVQGCIPGNQMCTMQADYGSAAGSSKDVDILVSYNLEPTAGNCIRGIFGGFVVPAGWYFQVTNSLEWIPVFKGQKPQLTMWLHRVTPSGFDYPKQTTPPPFLGTPHQGRMAVTSRNGSASTNAQYRFMCRGDQDFLTTGGTATIHMSASPIPPASGEGLSCLNKGGLIANNFWEG